jgi:HSP20 family protein
MASIVPWGRGRGNRGELASRRTNPLMQLQDEFDALWDRVLGGWPMAGGEEFGSQRFWDLDLEENEHEIVARAEVPGFEPNELDVQLNNNILTIKAEKKQEAKEGEKEGRTQQRRYMRYERSISLPSGTQADKAEAKYQHGVLELHIPRSEASKGRRITIQGAAQRQGALPGQTAGQQKTAPQRQEATGAKQASGAKQG